MKKKVFVILGYQALALLCAQALTWLILRVVVPTSDTTLSLAVVSVFFSGAALTCLFYEMLARENGWIDDPHHKKITIFAFYAMTLAITPIFLSFSGRPMSGTEFAWCITLGIIACSIGTPRVLGALKPEMDAWAAENAEAKPVIKTLIVQVNDTGGYRDKPIKLAVNLQEKTAEILGDDDPREKLRLVKLVLKSRSFLRRAFFVG